MDVDELMEDTETAGGKVTEDVLKVVDAEEWPIVKLLKKIVAKAKDN